ncbi:MAG: NAD(P)H:quinone oxidoreductase [Mycobacteriales bacterium]
MFTVGAGDAALVRVGGTGEVTVAAAVVVVVVVVVRLLAGFGGDVVVGVVVRVVAGGADGGLTTRVSSRPGGAAPWQPASAPQAAASAVTACAIRRPARHPTAPNLPLAASADGNDDGRERREQGEAIVRIRRQNDITAVIDTAGRRTDGESDDATGGSGSEPGRRDVRVAVIYYSATGGVYAMAQAAAQGAIDAGGEVRLRRVAEIAPAATIAASEAWSRHAEATAGVGEAAIDDVAWADVLLFGTPTRFGNVSAQLKAFLDTLGGLWGDGQLVDKVFAGFCSSATAHGGQEATLLALYHSAYHFGCIVVTPGYADPVQFDAGNPYGASHTSDNGQIPPGDLELAAAGFTGRRATTIGARLLAGSRASY